MTQDRPRRLRPSQGGKFLPPVVGDVSRSRDAPPARTYDVKFHFGPRVERAHEKIALSGETIEGMTYAPGGCALIVIDVFSRGLLGARRDMAQLIGYQTPAFDVCYADVVMRGAGVSHARFLTYLELNPSHLLNLQIIGHDHAAGAEVVCSRASGEHRFHIGDVSDFQTTRKQIPMSERTTGLNLAIIAPPTPRYTVGLMFSMRGSR